jgi:hypothetical protein
MVGPLDCMSAGHPYTIILRNAWNDCKEMSADEARTAYVKLFYVSHLYSIDPLLVISYMGIGDATQRVVCVHCVRICWDVSSNTNAFSNRMTKVSRKFRYNGNRACRTVTLWAKMIFENRRMRSGKMIFSGVRGPVFGH